MHLAVFVLLVLPANTAYVHFLFQFLFFDNIFCIFALFQLWFALSPIAPYHLVTNCTVICDKTERTTVWLLLIIPFSFLFPFFFLYFFLFLSVKQWTHYHNMPYLTNRQLVMHCNYQVLFLATVSHQPLQSDKE